jgi:superfamily II DNA or RNA helicase
VKGGEPQPILYLTAERTGAASRRYPAGWGYLPETRAGDDSELARAYLELDYAGIRVRWGQAGRVALGDRDDPILGVLRNPEAEATCVKRLERAGLHSQLPEETPAAAAAPSEEAGIGFALVPSAEPSAWFDLVLNEAARLREEGWRVEIDDDFPYRVVEHEEDWYAQVDQSPKNDWFGLDLGIQVEGRQVALLPLLLELLRRPDFNIRSLKKLKDRQPVMLRMEDGRYLPVPAGRVRNILSVLVELQGEVPLTPSGKLYLPGHRAGQLADLDRALADAKLHWHGGKQWRALGMRLQHFDRLRQIPPPQKFRATLRPYQQEGLSWLQFLREYGLGGILADDMGLGKTVQALAHLLLEKQQGRSFLPSLVVAPTSLMVNWLRETQRFAPDLKALVLHGPDRREHFVRMPEFDVVLTTYPLLPRDAKALLSQQFYMLILDEAQVIKNPRAKATQVALLLKAHHRLCLTGTPMENHLGELWSLFHFLMPGLLGEPKQFRKLFRVPIEKYADTERRNVLLRRIRPFILRRTKQAVVTELPPKTEILRTVELEGGQRDLYETIRLAMHGKVLRAIGRHGLQRSRMIILDALLKLRQVCCDPRLLRLDAAKRVTQSVKLELLMTLLPEMVEEGRRILLFSQFTSMLKLIEQALEGSGLEYVRLTGKTRDRATPVSRFQAGEVPLFLISLKAGGTGLNLTAADTVIHYDPWWNPAVEDQATDRAHRIGQSKAVFVYKLIAAHTVEEKILALQQKKARIARGLFEAEGGGEALTSRDLEALFEALS